MSETEIDYSVAVYRPRKTDPKTGRSGKIMQIGRANNWKIEGAFFGLTHALISSPAYSHLSTPARKIFDYLIHEHLSHGGGENGNLAAPYTLLVKRMKISSRDIPSALLMLECFGLIKKTNVTFFTNGRNNVSRYRLTMIPDKFGNFPTDEWRKVTLLDIKAFNENQKTKPKQ